MAEELSQARANADRIRFSGDVPQNFVIELDPELEEMHWQNAMEVSRALTPALWRRLKAACERLFIPEKTIRAFVYSSPMVQAECLPTKGSRCTIRFSSALLDLLNEDEFEFVLGHEVAHFLLRHKPFNPSEASYEGLILQRSQEISADRLGLIACASLDTALRALMKTVSGLTERHLRFDVASFVAQLRKIEEPSSDWSAATHPTIIIRAKALLWFSLCDLQKSGEDNIAQQVSLIDARVERDLQRFIDGSTKKIIEKSKNDLLFWLMTYEILQSGSFSKSDQAKMRAIFEPDVVEKLITFVDDLDQSERDSVIYEKVVQARSHLELLIPQTLEFEVSQMRARIHAELNGQ